MAKEKLVKGVKIGSLILTVIATIGTAWASGHENKMEIEKAVSKQLNEQ